MNWDRFDPTLVDPDLTTVIATLALVESRSEAYGGYLERVVGRERPTWNARIAAWASEEHGHGVLLMDWTRRAAPSLDVDAALVRYLDAVPYHEDAEQSVRGTIADELACRCTIEALATTLYQALAARAREPVLQRVLRHLAAEEARHYRMFLDLLTAERERSGAPPARSLLAMGRRLRALDDDQIMLAYHAVTRRGAAYDARTIRRALLPQVYDCYRAKDHRTLARLLLRVARLDHRHLVTAAAAAGGGLLSLRKRALRVR